MSFVGKLAKIFLCCKGEFVIPFFSESGSERLFQKLIRSQAELAPECLGAFAYFPSVEVDGRETAVAFQSHRIKVA